MQSKHKLGCLITLEGGEGAGKSTLMDSLALTLNQKGYDVIKTREPGGSKLGETIRQLLLQRHSSFEIGKQAELLLFLAARAQHIEELIRPAIQRGSVVLCDRFNDSTIAYQGAARGISTQQTETFCNLVCGEITPNLTLFLDIDPEVGLLRSKHLTKEHAKSGELDRIEDEKIEFHQRVRDGFLRIVNKDPERVKKIDATLSKEQVFQEALQFVESYLSTYQK